MAESSGAQAESAPPSKNVNQTRTSGGTPARLADETSQGSTSIAANVVQKVAGIATREISGVYAMGGGMSRAFGAIKERIPGSSTASSTSGVQVEVGEKQAAVDLDIIVEYGVSIVELARAVRRNVITAIEAMTGLEVTEVNIAVNDIHLPQDDTGEEQASSRVE